MYFVNSVYFKPCITFPGKAMSLPWDHARKYKISDKRTSLLQRGINEWDKKFYRMGLWLAPNLMN